jgi:hypothetical protein
MQHLEANLLFLDYKITYDGVAKPTFSISFAGHNCWTADI